MNADDLKKLFEIKDYKFITFKLVNGEKFTAKTFEVISPTSILTDGRTIINLNNVITATLRIDEFN